MKLKPTHQSLTESHTDVTAWQFTKTGFIPVWVARTFHILGGEGWTGIASGGVSVKAKVGDWVVAYEGVCCVFTNEEFKELFRTLPKT